MWDLKARQQPASQHFLAPLGLPHALFILLLVKKARPQHGCLRVFGGPSVIACITLPFSQEPNHTTKTTKIKTKFKPYGQKYCFFFLRRWTTAAAAAPAAARSMCSHAATAAVVVGLGTHMHDVSLSLTRINFTI